MYVYSGSLTYRLSPTSHVLKTAFSSVVYFPAMKCVVTPWNSHAHIYPYAGRLGDPFLGGKLCGCRWDLGVNVRPCGGFLLQIRQRRPGLHNLHDLPFKSWKMEVQWFPSAEATTTRCGAGWHLVEQQQQQQQQQSDHRSTTNGAVWKTNPVSVVAM